MDANRSRIGLVLVVLGLTLTSQAQQSTSPAIEFAQIPAGTFRMGCSSGDAQCSGTELPTHQVTLSRAFELGKHEVTQAQYQAVMGTNPSRFRGDNLPVDSVSWNDAQEFVSRLNTKRDGYRYRLPTEAEWEYAARAGTAGATPGRLEAIAWYGGNSEGKTHPGGEKQANPWGVFDMLGNVFEWVQDTAGQYQAAAVTDPKGPASELTARVVRGSFHGAEARNVRVSARINFSTTARDSIIGFRIVREKELPATANGSTPVSTANTTPMAFVRIVPGIFTMGCSPNDFQCTSIERPAHRVTLSKPFEIGKYEVTQGQYQSVMGTNPSHFKGDGSLPVEQVSWNDAQEFLNRLNAKRDGYHYRLPTEAEWEYAARAGTTASIAGNVDAIAWHEGNSGSKTHPVGQKQPNAWGLHDMLGNVCEWVEDLAALYSADTQTDPKGSSTRRDVRMMRGGSWADPARNARLSYRLDMGAMDRYFSGGLRLVRETVR